MSHDEILKTNNPDKKIEHFWLTFKNGINNFLSDEDKSELDTISKFLNQLQIEKKYDIIAEYIMNHIVKIGYKIISLDDYYRAGHLIKNLSRWDDAINEFSKLKITNIKKLNATRLGNYNNLFYCLLRIYYSQKLKIVTDKDKNNNFRVKLINNIINYVSDKDPVYLDKIIGIGIKYKIFGIIDKLKKFIDIRKFVKPGVKITDNYLKMSKGNKLYKILNPIL